MPLPVHAAIALGSNLGDRAGTLASAVAAIANLPLTSLVAQSRLHETQPVVPVGSAASSEPQGPYLNACVRVATLLTPRGLLSGLLAIEHAHGRDRTREGRFGSRTLDLDVLLYGDVTLRDEVNTPHLILPHPRLHERLFALEPLAQVWPDARVHGTSVRELIARLRS
jgi:2-amino-4-hydroxy-6-hydroxymethyldihydropteridine diphosphokinase